MFNLVAILGFLYFKLGLVLTNKKVYVFHENLTWKLISNLFCIPILVSF